MIQESFSSRFQGRNSHAFDLDADPDPIPMAASSGDDNGLPPEDEGDFDAGDVEDDDAGKHLCLLYQVLFDIMNIVETIFIINLDAGPQC